MPAATRHATAAPNAGMSVDTLLNRRFEIMGTTLTL